MARWWYGSDFRRPLVALQKSDGSDEATCCEPFKGQSAAVIGSGWGPDTSQQG